jgi:hypothetical protein
MVFAFIYSHHLCQIRRQSCCYSAKCISAYVNVLGCVTSLTCVIPHITMLVADITSCSCWQKSQIPKGVLHRVCDGELWLQMPSCEMHEDKCHTLKERMQLCVVVACLLTKLPRVIKYDMHLDVLQYHVPRMSVDSSYSIIKTFLLLQHFDRRRI